MTSKKTHKYEHDRLAVKPLILGLVVFLTSTVVALRASTAATDGHMIYALDDAYIHMAMAKNAAVHAVWGCTPFHFSSSSSSPLWTLLLAVAYATTGVREIMPFVLNVFLGAITLVIADRAMTHFGVTPVLRTIALVGLVITGMLPGMALMGMEHVLHVLLTLWFAGASAARLSTDTESTRRETLTICTLALLLASSRYEGLFLAGIVALAFIVRGRALAGLAIGVAALVPLAGYGLFSMANGAFFLPNSLMLKAAGAAASPLATLFKPFGAEDLAFYRSNPALGGLLLLGLAVTTVNVVTRRRFWRPAVLLPLWLSLMILLHGHFVFASTFWVYRYDVYLIAFGVIAGAVVLSEMIGRSSAATALPALAGAAALIALIGLVGHPIAALAATAEIDSARNTYFEHYELARFIRAYYPNDSVVVNDLGAVTYFTEARILDLVGLGDIEPLQITRRTGAYTRDDVESWTRAYAPTLAVIQLDWSWVAPRVPTSWLPVAEVAIPPRGQRIGFFAVNRTAAALLGANVEYHFGVLRASAGYRVRRF